MLDLTELGFQVLKSMDDSSKYDVVAERNGKFYRIQCKHSTWCIDTMTEKTAFYMSTKYQTTNTNVTKRYKYSENDIDYFFTWFNGQGYLVSIKEATGSSFRWRYEYPPTGQKQGIHIASNYKVEEVSKNW